MARRPRRGPRSPLGADARLWPLGRVPPDDPQENTRDHERLWLALNHLAILSGFGIEFNKDNQGGWLDVTVNDPDPDGNAAKIVTSAAEGDFLIGWLVVGTDVTGAGPTAGNVVSGGPLVVRIDFGDGTYLDGARLGEGDLVLTSPDAPYRQVRLAAGAVSGEGLLGGVAEIHPGASGLLEVVLDAGGEFRVEGNDGAGGTYPILDAHALGQVDIPLLYATLAGRLDANGFPVVDVLNPVNPQDAATKDYVDSAAPAAGANGFWRTVGGALTKLASIPWADLSGVPSTFPPSAHKDSHKSGGADAFASGDLLEAVVKRLRESSGPTDLTLGAVADGEYLKRSGTTIVSGTPAGGSGSAWSLLTDPSVPELVWTADGDVIAVPA
jgi:hypothetical protein